MTQGNPLGPYVFIRVDNDEQFIRSRLGQPTCRALVSFCHVQEKFPYPTSEHKLFNRLSRLDPKSLSVRFKLDHLVLEFRM